MGPNGLGYGTYLESGGPFDQKRGVEAHCHAPPATHDVLHCLSFLYPFLIEFVCSKEYRIIKVSSSQHELITNFNLDMLISARASNVTIQTLANCYQYNYPLRQLLE